MITVVSITDGGFSTDIGCHVNNVVLTDGETIVECKGCVWDGSDDLVETFNYWLEAAENEIEGFAIL